MKLYFAPLEGINGYIYRNAHHTFFPHMDKYFTPFISPNQNRALSPKEIKDILPENNRDMYVVPQILTNNAEHFIRTAEELRKGYGYQEVNLNLGCPSGTVVAKGKGSGFLGAAEELDCFLEKIFAESNLKISVKTRIGKDSPEEFGALLEIFNKYPLYELIVHPRIQKDFYNNKPNKEVFKKAVRQSKSSLCYNGDIFTCEDYYAVTEEFPQIDAVMMGRGLLANPGLAGEVLGVEHLDIEVIRRFHDRLYADYKETLFGEKTVLFKMKETWFYLLHIFTNYEKYWKRIKKATRLCDYEEIVHSLFREQEITKLH